MKKEQVTPEQIEIFDVIENDSGSQQILVTYVTYESPTRISINGYFIIEDNEVSKFDALIIVDIANKVTRLSKKVCVIDK